MYEYDLFAVICHEGGIDNGHYINFARSGDEVRPPSLASRASPSDQTSRRSGIDLTTTSTSSPFLFAARRRRPEHSLTLARAHRVTPATLGAVLAAPAYMCFYVKRHLDYKPYQTPTYILTREVEARKEEAREREKEAARLREVDDALMAIV